MQTAVLIQKAIMRQSAAKTRLPSPIEQFKTFLNRGAKPSPESKAEPPPPPPPEEDEKGETLPPPENEGGEPSGEPAPDGEAQDTPKEAQDASEEGVGESLPEAPETPQGVAEDAPAKKAGKQGGKRRGK